VVRQLSDAMINGGHVYAYFSDWRARPKAPAYRSTGVDWLAIRTTPMAARHAKRCAVILPRIINVTTTGCGSGAGSGNRANTSNQAALIAPPSLPQSTPTLLLPSPSPSPTPVPTPLVNDPQVVSTTKLLEADVTSTHGGQLTGDVISIDVPPGLIASAPQKLNLLLINPTSLVEPPPDSYLVPTHS
jgi:hypothetical protein